ncbi:MAG TPA: hypothetical protein VG317_18110 [Pseudonocardiaceae bacterium]|nr:hypothetical protein [Pseudonocardiaceae bacterium]
MTELTVESLPESASAGQGIDLGPLLAAYARHDPPRSIAVVGNAPLRPNAERAAAIDSADLVLRMTTFALDEPADPTADDTEPTFGNRTDVVVLHRGTIASPYTFADYTSRLYLHIEPGRMHWEPDFRPYWWPEDLGQVHIPNYQFSLPLVHLLGLDPIEANWATTGTTSVYLVSQLFPDAEIRLAGFSLLHDPEQVMFEHAWGTPVHVTPEHRLRAESALLHSWAAQGRITILP